MHGTSKTDTGFSGAAAVSRPLAEAADTSFTAHMVAHLLLGMLAPLLLALGAPITLLLRAFPVPAARRVSRVLASGPARFLTEPVVAAVLSLGGLWALYLTGLYPAMHHHPVVHVVVHVHLIVAGYLFTIAIVSVDPLPHRRSDLHRAVILILGLAAHDILAKYLYAHPPVGVSASAAESGAMVMYYGGDAVDVAIMVLLCARWYRTTGRRDSRGPRSGGRDPKRPHFLTPRPFPSNISCEKRPPPAGDPLVSHQPLVVCLSID